MMRIGIPSEIKNQESRVALTPPACAELVAQSHDVFIQQDAGLASGYADDEYTAVGARLVESARDLYEHCDLIVKVKEPQPEETRWLRQGQLLFCYLHLAAEKELVQLLLDSGVTAIGFEIVETNHSLPLLSPMSEIAGRLAAQVSTYLLHSNQGGKGLLLGGVTGTDPGHAIIIGAGHAGIAAMKDLLCIGAEVSLLDISQERLQSLQQQYPSIRICNSANPDDVAAVVATADIIIGAALVPGKKAPVVVTREMVNSMAPGGVIIDIAIDQGGCIETSQPTCYDEPIFIEAGQVHFCVTNMPGAVGRTATQALSQVILPYVSKLAAGGLDSNTALQGAIYLRDGEIQYASLK